jgi:hypothetical protein
MAMLQDALIRGAWHGQPEVRNGKLPSIQDTANPDGFAPASFA